MSCAICILAHNEENRLPEMLDSLATQSLLKTEETSVELFVVVNGSSDRTAQVARSHPLAKALGARLHVWDLADPGKSRAWNTFVHAPETSKFSTLVFCDADIDLPDPHCLSKLRDALAGNPSLDVFVSRPVKKSSRESARLVERLVLKAAGTSSDWKKAICGQLYAIRGIRARSIHMPIGLPVEDGFLRAMVLTDGFDKPEDLTRIDGSDEIFHLFAPEKTIAGLIHHETRIVIGGAINSVIFGELVSSDRQARLSLLRQSAKDVLWLPGLLKKRLPQRPDGWVPVHFLVKRSANMLRSANSARGLKRLVLLPVFFCFDLVCWALAQMKLARKSGAGFW